MSAESSEYNYDMSCILEITPLAEGYTSAIDCWNAYMERLLPDQSWGAMTIEPLSKLKETVKFHPARSKWFRDGMVESSSIAYEGNGFHSITTSAVLCIAGVPVVATVSYRVSGEQASAIYRHLEKKHDLSSR